MYKLLSIFRTNNLSPALPHSQRFPFTFAFNAGEHRVSSSSSSSSSFSLGLFQEKRNASLNPFRFFAAAALEHH